MNKIFRSLTALSMAAAVLAGCQEKEQQGGSTEITVAPESASFAAQSAQEVTLTVTADGAWLATGPDWLTITPTAGDGDATVTLTAKDNVDESGTMQGPRNGKVTFVLIDNSSVLATVAVDQEGDKSLDKSHTYVKVDKVTSGKAYLFVAKAANQDDALVIPILFSDTGTYGYPKTTKVEPNEDGSITMSDETSGLVLTEAEGGYTIQQYNGRYIWHESGYKTWSCATLGTVPSQPYAWTVTAREDGTFEMTLNGGLLAYGTENYTSWGCYASADEYSVYPFLYEDTKDVVLSNDYLSVATKDITVAASATSAEFTVSSNLAWTVTKTDGDWISNFAESGNGDGKITVNFDANETEDARTATFTVASAEPAISVNLTLTQNGIVTSYDNIADVQATEDTEKIWNVKGTVVATYGRGCLVKDETGYILWYKNATVDFEIGDIITVSGVVSSYAGFNQFTADAVAEKVATDEAFAQPEAVALDGAHFEELLAGIAIEYVSVEGLLSISGNYYNVAIDGTTTEGASASISYPVGVSADLNGHKVAFKAYTIGTSKSMYVNVMVAGEIEDLGAELQETDHGATTVADFIAATESSMDWYQLTGVVTSIDNNKYNDFYIEDETGSVYVYGLYPSKGADRVLYYVDSLGLAVNDTITLVAQRSSYNGTVQAASAYYVSHSKYQEPAIEAKLFINEICCTADENSNKWFEIYNAGETEVDLANYTLKKGKNIAKGLKDSWAFSSLAEGTSTKIAAGGFYVVTCNNTNPDATKGPEFGLSGDGGLWLQILDAKEEVVDEFYNPADGDTFFAIPDSTTYGRISDGAADWVVFVEGSKGETNANGVRKADYSTAAEASAAILGGATSFTFSPADYLEVTYVNGTSVFVEDATAGLLLYGTGLESAAYCGLRIKGFMTVTAKVFNGVPEITKIEGLENIQKDYNAKYPCTNLTLAELLANYDRYVNCKVKIAGVSVADGWKAGDRNGVVAQGTDSLNVYVQVKTDSLEVKTGCEGDIVAWPTYYKTNKQLGFWPHAESGKTYFTVTKEAGEEEEPEPEYLTTCAEVSAAILKGETTVYFQPADWVEFTYINGKSAFAQDATGGVLFFGTGLESWVYGGLRIKGTFVLTTTLFNGVPEITAVENTNSDMQKDYNAKYPCTNITLADLLKDYDKYLNCKVKISGVTVADGWQGSTDRNGVVAVGTDSVNVYCQVKTDTLQVETGCEGNIVCFPTYYKTTKQVGFWPADYSQGKTFFTVTKAAPSEDPGEDPAEEPETVVYTNCAELNAAILADSTSFKCNFANAAEITLMGADNKSIFVQDATGAVLIYGADIYTALKAQGAQAGVGISGEFSGTCKVFNGVPEIVSVDLSNAKVAGVWAFPCKNITIADLLADYNKYLNCKVKIDGVDVADGWSASDRNGKITSGESEIAVYVSNTGITDVIYTGSKGNFVGYVSAYRTTKQLGYWETGKFKVTSAPGVVTVAATKTLAEGATWQMDATSNSGAQLTYASSNEAVATVDTAGVVTAVAAGTATITVTVAAKDIYTEGSATCEVTVESAEVTHINYALVKDVTTLAAGDSIIIAAAGASFAISATQGNNNRTAVAVTKDGDNIVDPSADVEIIVLAAGNADSTFAFSTNEGYLYAASSSKNYLKSESTLSDNSSWTVEIDSEGKATIKAQGTNTRNWLRYNSSSALFACYASGQEDVAIYKLVKE